jgi:hypothetical protein
LFFLIFIIILETTNIYLVTENNSISLTRFIELDKSIFSLPFKSCYGKMQSLIEEGLNNQLKRKYNMNISFIHIGITIFFSSFYFILKFINLKFYIKYITIN